MRNLLLFSLGISKSDQQASSFAREDAFSCLAILAMIVVLSKLYMASMCWPFFARQ